MEKSSGVKYYTKGVMNVRVYFPEDDTSCRGCQFLRSESELRRHKCAVTHELLFSPFCDRGLECPVKIEDE